MGNPGSRLLVCMDAGQTGTRAVVRDGEVDVGRFDLPGVRSDRDIVDQLAGGLRMVTAGVPGREFVVAIGASGLRHDDDPARLLGVPGVVEASIAHDSTTSYLAALGDAPGVVLAVGTGTVVLAVGPTRVARVDGWGHLLDDAGSGFWIGRQALRAVLRAHDGRGPATTLTEPVTERYPDLDVLSIELQTDPQRVSVVASFARAVSDHAATDEVARGILIRAASELVTSALTALRRVDLADLPDPAVGLVGNVFRSDVLLTHFAEGIRRQIPGARLINATGDGIAGAALLPQIAEDSALRGLVTRVTR